MTFREAMLLSGGINQHYNGPAERGRPVDTFINVDCAMAERLFMRDLLLNRLHIVRPAWMPTFVFNWLVKRIRYEIR